jgi:hypothetical protein
VEWNIIYNICTVSCLKDAEITHEVVLKKLMEIVAARGKKKTNRKEQIELLNELLNISNDHGLGPGMAIKIKFAIIAALFDYNPKLSDAMKPDSWEKCIAGVDSLLDMMEEHETTVTTGELIMEENEVLDAEPYKIRGCYLTAVERLDEEFIKVGLIFRCNYKFRESEAVIAILLFWGDFHDGSCTTRNGIKEPLSEKKYSH